MTTAEKSTISSKLRLASLIGIALIFIVFSIANAATVEVNFLFGTMTTRRFVLLFGTFGLGMLCGWLLRPKRRKENVA